MFLPEPPALIGVFVFLLVDKEVPGSNQLEPERSKKNCVGQSFSIMRRGRSGSKTYTESGEMIRIFGDYRDKKKKGRDARAGSRRKGKSADQ